jgi:hypothetical protein
MNQKAREFLRRLFSFRNIAPLLIIIGAFVGTFIENPFGLKREQLLLGLLAFLAIDALVERLELLTNIEDDVKSIKQLVTSRTSSQHFLKQRKDFPQIEKMVEVAKEEIWVNGIKLDTMAAITALFKLKLSKGVKLRFLAISPEDETVNETSGYFGSDVEDLLNSLKVNLNTLSKRLAHTNPEQVEIRTIKHRPSLAYFIVDPNHEDGYMTVFPYFYQSVGNYEPPFLLLYKKTDSYWFYIYLKDFETLWNNAEKWSFNS